MLKFVAITEIIKGQMYEVECWCITVCNTSDVFKTALCSHVSITMITPSSFSVNSTTYSTDRLPVLVINNRHVVIINQDLAKSDKITFLKVSL